MTGASSTTWSSTPTASRRTSSRSRSHGRCSSRPPSADEGPPCPPPLASSRRAPARGPRNPSASPTDPLDRGRPPAMTVPVPDATTDDGHEPSTLPTPGSDPEWYKRAVFYEVLVRGFADSNADGVGDLRGMADKLDHLQWLGVDCLWLPPFFASPLRDGGYDVSDYTAVLPEF